MFKAYTAAMLLPLIGAVGLVVTTNAAQAGMKRTITMVAVEAKGGTTIDKEPFPTAALPDGKGYELEAPNAEGRWEVTTLTLGPQSDHREPRR